MVPIGALAGSLLTLPGSASSFAEPSTPPPPPTFVPTPIGPPPGPPTFAPTSGPGATDTPVVATSPTPVATAASSPTVTATKAAPLQFSLDAIRVSKVNNPGNLEGLAAIKPGSKVWLMMYFTVNHLPGKTKRTTSYSIGNKAGKTLFKVTYSDSQKSSELGRFSRYTVYSAPHTLSYGHYVYHASLAFGSKTRSLTWKFSVGKQERVATTTKVRP